MKVPHQEPSSSRGKLAPVAEHKEELMEEAAEELQHEFDADMDDYEPEKMDIKVEGNQLGKHSLVESLTGQLVLLGC